MRIKYCVNQMETMLKRQYPEISLEIYCSRRKKLIHLATEKSMDQYTNYQKFLDDIESLFNRFFVTEFELCKPIKLNNTVKWKFNYIIFRKHCSH